MIEVGTNRQANDPTERTIAFPSFAPGGLQAERSGHFGHCEVFTLVKVQEDGPAEVRTVLNLPHSEGGCLRPIEVLAGLGATDVVVAGIGRRPLAGFQEAGISVYFDDRTPVVQDALAELLQGRMRRFLVDQACGGHGGCHDGAH